MADEWSIYFKDQSGPPVVCMTNLGAAEVAPDPERPTLLTVAVALKETNEDGLNTPAETEALYAFEDDLTETLGGELEAAYVGRVTTQGTQTLYFYLSADESKIETLVEKVAGRHRRYSPICGVKSEPDWRTYFETLYPSELEMHLLHSVQLLKLMQEHGDDGSEPRRVEHWLYFRTPEDRAAMKERLGALGYQVEEEWNEEERAAAAAAEAADEEEPEEAEPAELPAGAVEQPFGLRIAREQTVELTAVADAIRELYRLADEAGGGYDGWETEHKGEDMPGLEHDHDHDHECGPGCGHE